MPIIQSLLGNNIHPLGISSSLSNPHKMLLRKESLSLNSRSNFISFIQTKPLVTSSKFFLSSEHEVLIEPLIGWDIQDINNEPPLLTEFDSFDLINPGENSNETITTNIPEIMPTRIENNTSNDMSSKTNIIDKNKSKSKKANKSKQPPEKKSTIKSKSQTKRTVKSSANKFIDENILFNLNENNLLASDESIPVEANLELPKLQLDLASDNITSDHNPIDITTPNITTSISPSVEEKSILFRNVSKDYLQVNPELASSSPSAESSVIESILELQQENKLDDNASEIAETSVIEFPVLCSHLNNNEQLIIPEVSELVNISHIPVNPTLPQQDIQTDQLPSIIDNQITASPTNLIQKQKVLPTFSSPSLKESPYVNTNFEAITPIEPDLILEQSANDFVIENAVADNSLENTALSSALTSPDVDDTLHFLANDENIVGTHSYTPLQDVAVPNSKSSVAQSPITIQQEIVSNFTSQSPASTSVQLTPISGDIEDTPSLFTSDNNEQLVTLDSQSAIAVNVLDVSANVTSLQHDSNIENTTSEYTESHSILALPEIGEAPIVNDTPPEIGEALVATAISPEIVETESIFRKIIDDEQPVESEFLFTVTNPEISTFVDTSDKPDIPEEATSLQNEVSISPKVEQNAIAENLPAPKGYATGGHVTDSQVENRQHIAPSDIIPAMLTPGEFVINTRDAQKNLPLLHHINTGGTPQDIILPSLQTPNPTEPEATTFPETSTKVDSFPDTSLQLKTTETDSPQISKSFIPSSLGLNISKQKLSILNSPQLNPLQNETIDVAETSPQYSSPPLIFRKANPTTNTPSQWSSVEDLLNGNNDDFTSFNFNDGESNNQNYEFSQFLEPSQVFAKHLPSSGGFANGKEVTPPDISREIKPVTETIQSASSTSKGDNKDDTADLEALAREIYHRLRQRIEIERERHGGYSGRLPW